MMHGQRNVKLFPVPNIMQMGRRIHEVRLEKFTYALLKYGSPSRFSWNSRWLDRFLYRTLIPNFMEVQQTI